MQRRNLLKVPVIGAFTLYGGWGLEIPVIWPSRNVPKKRKCWSQLNIGVYGGKEGFRPPFVIDTSKPKMKTMTGILGPKQIFFSLTVCTLEQY